MKVKLLKQVRDYIKTHPTKYDQREYCGTACCIAGHAAILSGAMTAKAVTSGKFENGVRHIAQEALGLDADQAVLLLDSYDFGGTSFSLLGIRDPKERAIIAVKRINHFIKTGGTE